MAPDRSGESWRDAALVLDILLAAEDALSFVAGLDERAFLASDLHQSAVIRKLEIMVAQLRDALTAQLAAGSARVLKQNRGNDGQGVWKVEPVASRGGSMVRITEAAQDGPAEEVPLEAFLARCEPYFERGVGTIIDQPFQERLGDGMIRCYMAADRVAGFAHQYPKGLLPPSSVRPHTEKRMYPPDAEPFQRLRGLMEDEWTPQMIGVLGLRADELPIIWDADFLYGPKTATGADSYVLCEINVSSVFAIPNEAPAAIARLVAQRVASGSNPQRTALGRSHTP